MMFLDEPLVDRTCLVSDGRVFKIPIRKNRHEIAVADGKCLFFPVMLEQFPTVQMRLPDNRLAGGHCLQNGIWHSFNGGLVRMRVGYWPSAGQCQNANQVIERGSVHIGLPTPVEHLFVDNRPHQLGGD